MIVVGIGCRKNCPADEIVTLVESTLQTCGLMHGEVSMIVSAQAKAQDASLIRAATALSWPLVFVSTAAMQAVSALAHTHSDHVMNAHGVPSVAETAALAAAGKNARLLQPRMLSPMAACAIAMGEGA